MASTQREQRLLLKQLIPRILFPRSKTVTASPDVAVPVQSVPISSISNGHIGTSDDVHPRTRVFSRLLSLSIGRRRRVTPNLTVPRRTLLQAFVHPLKILEKTAEGIPVPGLKGAVGALVAVVDIIQETEQNKRDLQDIVNMVERLDYLLSPFRTLPNREIEIPVALKEHIEGFQNGLVSIEDTCRNLRNCTLVDGLLYSSDDQQIIAGVFRQLRFLLESLLTGSVLRIEVNTSNIHTDVHSLIINAIPRSQAARWRNGTLGECLEGTRTAILEDLMTWILDESDTRSVCWLNSVAGAGKSTVARSVAHWAADRGILGGSFFCSRNDSQQKDARLIIPTIAFHLSELDMAFRQELVSVVRNWDGIDLEMPSQQLERLVIKPLLNTGRHSDPLLLVIDALDECTNEIARRELVSGFLSITHDLHALRVLITSRPEVPERETFQSVSNARWKDVILHRMDRREVDADIRTYLHAKLITMVPSSPISGDSASEAENAWPPENLLDQLVQKSAGLFIFATTVCRFIESPGDRAEQLIQIASVSESHNEGEYGLDHLYRRTVSSAIEDLPDSKVNDLRTVLGTIILLQQPMTLHDLCLLLKMTRNRVEGMLSRFHSVVVVPSDDHDFVRLFHSSFRDFLTSNTRCSNKCEMEWCMNSRECGHTKLFVSRLRVRPAQNHRSICFRLLDLMKDAFSNPHVGTGDKDGTTFMPCSDDDILGYACLYWSDHLSFVSTHNIAEVRIVVDLVNSFLCEKGDAWLSYMGKDAATFKIGVRSLDTIDEWGAKLPGQFKLLDWTATARTNFTAMVLLGNLS